MTASGSWSGKLIEAQERKQNEKRDVWVCFVSEGSVALALTVLAVGHRKGVLKSYRSLLC